MFKNSQYVNFPYLDTQTETQTKSSSCVPKDYDPGSIKAVGFSPYAIWLLEKSEENGKKVERT